MTDSKGQKTEFTYDERDLLKTRRYPAPDGGAELAGWKYDQVNHLLERPTVGGAKQLFTYDDRNQLKNMRWSSAVDWSDFDYDLAGRLKFAKNPYSTVDLGYDAAGRLKFDKQTPAAVLNAPASSVAPQSVVSRRTHGSVGAFDIPLPLSGAPGVESRSGGSYTLVLTFAYPVTVASATVSSGTGTVASFGVSGNVITVELSGVSNAQRLTVALAGVTQNGVADSVIVPMHVLVGDATGDGQVSSSDVGMVSSLSG